MSWKNFPGWLKGGIVVEIIYLISLFFALVNISYISTLGILASFSAVILMNLFVSLFKLNSCSAVAFTFDCPVYIDIITFIVVGIFYFIVGAIIGFIVGKIKNRNGN